MANDNGYLTRREIIKGGTGLGAVGISALGGCLDELDDNGGSGSGLTGGPDPRVTDVEADQDLTGALSGTVDVYVLVQNTGDDGPVDVTVTIYDENRNVLERVTQSANIRADESRRVDFEIESPDGADRFNAEADPA